MASSTDWRFTRFLMLEAVPYSSAKRRADRAICSPGGMMKEIIEVPLLFGKVTTHPMIRVRLANKCYQRLGKRFTLKISWIYFCRLSSTSTHTPHYKTIEHTLLPSTRTGWACGYATEQSKPHLLHSIVLAQFWRPWWSYRSWIKGSLVATKLEVSYPTPLHWWNWFPRE